MSGFARAATAHWVPRGPKTRPFRHGLTRAPTDEDGLAAGTVVGGKYRVVRTIGVGGMGRVYEAVQEPLGRTVALKLLHRDMAGGDQVARFRQEAKAATRVGHPAIVDVLDQGIDPDGTVFLVMERLVGRSYEDWLEGTGRLSDGLSWLADAADGLQAAHRAGIVHRDIKPDNVFLHEANGSVQPKVLDFGIAKATATDLTQIETQAGTILGTPYYLAPERALGKTLDPRADLYSLGVMLYETMTGNVPFIDDNFMGILAQHMRAAPLDPRQAAPDRALPDDLCALTLSLLAKDPRDRPSSAAFVAEALRRIVADHGTILAAVITGPRETSGPSEPTQNLAAIAQRPTTMPLGSDGSPVAGADGEHRTRPVGSGSAAALASAGVSGSGVIGWSKEPGTSEATARTVQVGERPLGAEASAIGSAPGIASDPSGPISVGSSGAQIVSSADRSGLAVPAGAPPGRARSPMVGYVLVAVGALVLGGGLAFFALGSPGDGAEAPAAAEASDPSDPGDAPADPATPAQGPAVAAPAADATAASKVAAPAPKVEAGEASGQADAAPGEAGATPAGGDEASAADPGAGAGDGDKTSGAGRKRTGTSKSGRTKRDRNPDADAKKPTKPPADDLPAFKDETFD